MSWLRVRFQTTESDYRPIVFPAPGPWWCSGSSSTHNILIAYVKDLNQILEFWPEAEHIEDPEEQEEITFTDRFPKPSWWNTESDE